MINMDRFVDSMIEDALLEAAQEADFDRAADRRECTERWVQTGHLVHCKRYAAAVRNRTLPLTRRQMATERKLRGLCQEQQFVRARCLRGGSGSVRPDVYWQVRIDPSNRRSPVVDMVVPDAARRRQGHGVVYEHKSIDAAHYLNRPTQLELRVQRDVEQVLKKIAWSKRSGSVIPATYRHILAYTVNGAPRDPATRDFIRDVIVTYARTRGVFATVSFSRTH